jgi:hypothetical protein
MTHVFGRRVLRHAAWLAVPMLAVSACARAQAKPLGSHHAAPVPAMVAPLSGLTSQSPRAAARLQLALDMLIADCMRSRSYSFEVPHLPMPPAGATLPNAYGLISGPVASRQGYGISASILADEEDTRLGSELQPDAHEAGFSRALAGTSAAARSIPLPGGSHVTFNANGCSTIAVSRLYGNSWGSVYYTVSALVFRIVRDVEASGAWKTAVGAWSRCVRESYGTFFPNPSAAEGSVRNNASEQLAGLSGGRYAQRLRLVRASEIRLATLDARCQAKTHLAAAASKAQGTAELPYEKQYAGDLKAYAAGMRHATKVATAVLKQSPGLS